MSLDPATKSALERFARVLFYGVAASVALLVTQHAADLNNTSAAAFVPFLTAGAALVDKYVRAHGEPPPETPTAPPPAPVIPEPTNLSALGGGAITPIGDDTK